MYDNILFNFINPQPTWILWYLWNVWPAKPSECRLPDAVRQGEFNKKGESGSDGGEIVKFLGVSQGLFRLDTHSIDHRVCLCSCWQSTSALVRTVIVDVVHCGTDFW